MTAIAPPVPTVLPNPAPAIAPPTRLTADAGVPLSVDEEKRTLEIVLATATRDRQGDVVEPAGLDFGPYLKNPVVLWAHDLARPPVGRILGVTVSGDTAEATVQFADTPFATEVFRLYAKGFLKAWSVGFLPRRWEKLPREEGSADGYRVREAEVVEVSAVPVPANRETLTRQLKQVSDTALRASLEQTLAARDATPPRRAAGVLFSRKQLGALADRLFDAVATNAFERHLRQARGALS